jgi:hypothetical protein
MKRMFVMPIEKIKISDSLSSGTCLFVCEAEWLGSISAVRSGGMRYGHPCRDCSSPLGKWHGIQRCVGVIWRGILTKLYLHLEGQL